MRIKNSITFGLSMLLAAILIAPTAFASEVFDSSLSDPGVYWGTGNVNSGWDVLNATNSTDGSQLQLGMTIIDRFVGPAPSTANDYYVTPSSGPDASWDFAFSVNTGTDPLSAYNYALTVVNDTTDASYTFNPTFLPDNGQANGSGVVCNGCAYNGSNDGMQNAENLGFAFLAAPLGFNPSADDNYTFTLSAIPISGVDIDPSVTVNAIMTATPEPKTYAFLGLGFIAMLLFERRRRLVLSRATK